MLSLMCIHCIGMVRNCYLGKTKINCLDEKSFFKKLGNTQFLLLLFSFAKLKWGGSKREKFRLFMTIENWLWFSPLLWALAFPSLQWDHDASVHRKWGIKMELGMGKSQHIIDAQGILFFSISSLSAWELNFTCKTEVVHFSMDHWRERI